MTKDIKNIIDKPITMKELIALCAENPTGEIGKVFLFITDNRMDTSTNMNKLFIVKHYDTANLFGQINLYKKYHGYSVEEYSLSKNNSFVDDIIQGKANMILNKYAYGRTI